MTEILSVSVCIHGLPKKLNACLACDNDKKFQELLEHKTRQLDENRAVFKRLNELEAIIKTSRSSTDFSMENNAHRINERLTELEQWTRKDEDRIHEKLKELERFQDIAHFEYKNRNQKPYRCPVCDGTKFGNVKKWNRMTNEIKDVFDTCIICEGKGVIWG
jgi:hypothetical protein